MAVITLAFTAHWFLSRAMSRPPRLARPCHTGGLRHGVTTMLAHAGGPPIAMYLLRRGCPSRFSAGTMSIAFTAGNLIKLPPWLLVAEKAHGFLLAAADLPAVIPLAVALGWRLHNWLDEKRSISSAICC